LTRWRRVATLDIEEDDIKALLHNTHSLDGNLVSLQQQSTESEIIYGTSESIIADGFLIPEYPQPFLLLLPLRYQLRAIAEVAVNPDSATITYPRTHQLIKPFDGLDHMDIFLWYPTRRTADAPAGYASLSRYVSNIFKSHRDT